jgi:hypothetical protein
MMQVRGRVLLGETRRLNIDLHVAPGNAKYYILRYLQALVAAKRPRLPLEQQVDLLLIVGGPANVKSLPASRVRCPSGTRAVLCVLYLYLCLDLLRGVVERPNFGCKNLLARTA